MIKYIVFDFDGTIADTYQEIVSIVNKFKKEEYGEIDFEDLRNYGAKKIIKKIGISPLEVPRLIKELLFELRKKTDIKIFPEMLGAFKNLNRNYKIGIVTSNSEENVKKILQKYKAGSLFEFIYTGSSLFGKHKTLKKMCKEYNLNPKEIIYVGDEDRDIVAAKKVGIKIIGVTWGFNSEKRLREESPDYLVHSPKEILDIVKKIK